MKHNLIGKNILFLRKEKKLSQEEVGELLGGKSSQIVGKYERGSSLPPLDVIYQLAEILEVSAGDLISIDFSNQDYEPIEIKKVEEKNLTEAKVMPLIQALKESQDKCKKLEAKIRKQKKSLKKLGVKN